MSEDEANRMIYEARLKAQRDEYSRVQGARKEGLEEGLEQGLEQGLERGRQEERNEDAQTLKALGIPVEKITHATGLSPDEIAALQRAGDR
jgi:predicted transposase/invertase (TIGR01784 family)